LAQVFLRPIFDACQPSRAIFQRNPGFVGAGSVMPNRFPESHDVRMLEMLRDLVAHKGHSHAALLNSIRQNEAAAADPEL
jgi:hypothetical protein